MGIPVLRNDMRSITIVHALWEYCGVYKASLRSGEEMIALT
jgi:hypothetical protein